MSDPPSPGRPHGGQTRSGAQPPPGWEPLQDRPPQAPPPGWPSVGQQPQQGQPPQPPGSDGKGGKGGGWWSRRSLLAKIGMIVGAALIGLIMLGALVSPPENTDSDRATSGAPATAT